MGLTDWLCGLFALTPEQELEYRQIEIDCGYPLTSAEQAQSDWEDTLTYLDHMPIEKDVWYDGEFTGYYQYYQTDHNGNRHYVSDVQSFYAGHTGEPPEYPLDVVVQGEVVEEYKPVYMRLQGNGH